MPKLTTPSWPEAIREALLQDPKKTGVLGVLVLILLILSARVMIGRSRPGAAAGAIIAPMSAPARIVIPTPPSRLDGTTALLRAWLSAPVPKLARNDFLLKSEYSPAGAAGTAALPPPTGFWNAVKKFLSVQADQKEKRDAVIATLKTQAAALRPTSTVMGAMPRAMVNGSLVREGEMVGSFRVLKIEARGIVVESDGIRLAIPMN